MTNETASSSSTASTIVQALQASVPCQPAANLPGSLNVINSTPLVSFENLESALSTTLGTQGRCTTLPLVNLSATRSVDTSVYSTAAIVADSTLNSEPTGSLSHSKELTSNDPPINGAIFHVGTPPMHFIDSSSQTDLVNYHDNTDHIHSPATSYSSDFELQVYKFSCILKMDFRGLKFF